MTFDPPLRCYAKKSTTTTSAKRACDSQFQLYGTLRHIFSSNLEVGLQLAVETEKVIEVLLR